MPNRSVILEQKYRRLLHSVTPEDVFGQLQEDGAESQIEQVRDAYRSWQRDIDPQRYKADEGDYVMAKDAILILNRLLAEAERKIDRGIYDTLCHPDELPKAMFTIATPARTYCLTAKIAEGDFSEIFGGFTAGEKGLISSVIVKIALDKECNSFLDNEARLVRILTKRSSPQSKHLPVLLDRFESGDGKRGLVLAHHDGLDLYAIRQEEKYRNGIPPKHVVWMLNRALSAIGYAHSLGTLHCNLDPSHLMLRKRDHNLWLESWGCGVFEPAKSREGFKFFNEQFSAPEIEQRKSPLPSCDLWSLGKCAIFALGGNVETGEMPDFVEEPLQRFIRYMVLESPLQRAMDAWAMHGELARLVVSMWGPKVFLPFD